MRFIMLFSGVFLLTGIVGCANNPTLNGMRYDVDIYRANNMLEGDGKPNPLSHLTGMRYNVDEYRSLNLLPNEEYPLPYHLTSGMRKNIDGYRALRMAEGSTDRQDEIAAQESELSQ